MAIKFDVCASSEAALMSATLCTPVSSRHGIARSPRRERASTRREYRRCMTHKSRSAMQRCAAARDGVKPRQISCVSASRYRRVHHLRCKSVADTLIVRVATATRNRKIVCSILATSEVFKILRMCHFSLDCNEIVITAVE